MSDEEGFETVVKAGVTVVYKHSDRCFTCRRSLRQMERFVEEKPGIPVYIVDVIGQRALSSRIAEKLGIRHESPQAILIVDGRPVWNGSHFAVTAEALENEIDRLTDMD